MGLHRSASKAVEVVMEEIAMANLGNVVRLVRLRPGRPKVVADLRLGVVRLRVEVVEDQHPGRDVTIVMVAAIPTEEVVVVVTITVEVDTEVVNNRSTTDQVALLHGIKVLHTVVTNIVPTDTSRCQIAHRRDKLIMGRVDMGKVVTGKVGMDKAMAKVTVKPTVRARTGKALARLPAWVLHLALTVATILFLHHRAMMLHLHRHPAISLLLRHPEFEVKGESRIQPPSCQLQVITDQLYKWSRQSTQNIQILFSLHTGHLYN